MDAEQKLKFFEHLEQNFNADQRTVGNAYSNYSKDPSSSNLNKLSKAAEPQRQELLRRLNSTPDATHDLVEMRTDLLKCLAKNTNLKSVDEDFIRLFTSWFGRGFLVLQTIDWSTSAAILDRIIRYEAVHEIKDWDDLRSRIDPPNRRCFAFFHPALTDEPLIFVEVALSTKVPSSIASILESDMSNNESNVEYTTATFYGISNCQPGLKNISFGNFLIKQVVQELQIEFPSIKTFVTLSPIPGFQTWLCSKVEEELPEISGLQSELNNVPKSIEELKANSDLIKKTAFNYLLRVKKGKYPSDPVARFHLGNGASIYQLNVGADLSKKWLDQSWGTMVNYLYDLNDIEENHEAYATEGEVKFNDKLKSLLTRE
tara:strand:- start:652 stop:1770 length:1119 start_codon:yes stop_codon:yes gene_type:complete